MPDQNTQPPISTDPSIQALGQPGANGMSSDDLAAALGYITTLSEHMFHQGQNPVDELQGQSQPQQKEPPKESATETKKDTEQDKEIADIRAQLEKLIADEENEQEGTSTTTTQ